MRQQRLNSHQTSCIIQRCQGLVVIEISENGSRRSSYSLVRSVPDRRSQEGLNQMTICRSEEILQTSLFVVEELELVPIRRMKPLHNGVTREFLTAVVAVG